jgi:hypothetical protein
MGVRILFELAADLGIVRVILVLQAGRVTGSSQSYWHTPVTPALKSLSQEDRQFEVILG